MVDDWLYDTHMTREILVSKIQQEFGGNKIDEQHHEYNCYPPISGEIEKIIAEVGPISCTNSSDLVRNACYMEEELKSKCEELRKHKLLLMKLCQYGDCWIQGTEIIEKPIYIEVIKEIEVEK